MKSEIEEIGPDEHRCLIKDMEATLERVRPPKLEPNCCIYKVLGSIRKANPKAYTPNVVSIGPFHHGDEGLKPMEELKLGYLKSYLERTNMKLEDCIEKIRKKEEYIRNCYAETISQRSDDFVKMILVDACFIIEYFLRRIELTRGEEIADPIISKPSWSSEMIRDLLLLENQLPFSVLEDLFPIACFGSKYSSFLEVSTHNFRTLTNINAKLDNDEFTFEYFREHHLKEVKVLHLTDLLRICFLPCRELQPKTEYRRRVPLHSASKLVEAGVKFKVCDTDKSLTELKFEKSVLTIPPIVVDFFFETSLRNMAAFEQCHYPYETYIGCYIDLLNSLINDRKAVDVLVDKRIMITTTGDEDKVVAKFSNISRGLGFPSYNVEYIQLIQKLNDFYEKPLHKYKAIFVRDYLSTPWKVASFVAATILLFLTLIQTIFSIISKP